MSSGGQFVVSPDICTRFGDLSLQRQDDQMISRASGRSAVASAAYRSASTLYDERLGRAHDYSAKPGVVHSENPAARGGACSLARSRGALERGRGGGKTPRRAARQRSRDRLAARARSGRGDPVGAGLRARAIRRSRHGGRPERALGQDGGRRGAATCACDADHAPDRTGGEGWRRTRQPGGS